MLSTDDNPLSRTPRRAVVHLSSQGHKSRNLLWPGKYFQREAKHKLRIPLKEGNGTEQMCVLYTARKLVLKDSARKMNERGSQDNENRMMATSSPSERKLSRSSRKSTVSETIGYLNEYKKTNTCGNPGVGVSAVLGR